MINRLDVLAIALIVTLTASATIAQEATPGMVARVEMTAHQRLLDMRTRPDAKLYPFTTDGCSGGMSASWQALARVFPDFAELHLASPPWEPCCVVHDRAYHSGGDAQEAEDSYEARLKADEALQSCVLETAETRRDTLRQEYGVSDMRIDQLYDLISASMFDAVRVGGGPCSGLPWRWGYGWPQCGVFSD